jgi:hypothetical protein
MGKLKIFRDYFVEDNDIKKFRTVFQVSLNC